MAVQTRSDKSDGLYSGLHFFNTVEEAYNAFLQDTNIWKISWDNNRFLSKFKNEIWTSEIEQALCKMNNIYKHADKFDLFWINSPITILKFEGNICGGVTEILSDTEFKQKFFFKD